MDRTNSLSNGQKHPSSTAPFAYQQRLLERTLSRGGSGSLSRTSSQTSSPLLASPTGTPTRRWTRSHRIGGSLDLVRGKWEERVKSDAVEPRSPFAETSTDGLGTHYTSAVPIDSSSADNVHSTRYADLPPRSSSTQRSSTPDSEASSTPQTTPLSLKRQSLPAHIVATPLSPNNTGISVESPDSPDSPFSTPTARIRFPLSSHQEPQSRSAHYSRYSVPLRDDDSPSPSVRLRRSNTLESVQASSTGSSTASDATSSTSATSFSARTLQSDASSAGAIKRRPTSMYTSHRSTLSSPDVNKYILADPPRPSATMSRTFAAASELVSNFPSPKVFTPGASSAMSPQPFRSSYMNRKSRGDGERVVRRFERHLPRIASGDAPDDWEEEEEEKKVDEELPPEPAEDWRTRVAAKERRLRDSWSPSPEKPSPEKPSPEKLSPEKRRPRAPSMPAMHDAHDVVGIPGRMRLSRDTTPSTPTSPLPSARLTRGLWADVQRHLLQAYEYLCHVGEAQQWIEGCLGEETGFDVVEMEERMRNGVVLARLVRVFEPSAVRRIYEAPKLDFRHSDNINIFFNFVRHVGLPESFIFELTDLYEKKNFPKVIYCIHALSHLMAKRGMAERIGNLVGHLQFSDDQLQRIDKGLKDSGVAMPNFRNVGKELAKEINEEPEEEEETEEERRDRLLLENESSVIAAQALARAFLVRKAQATQKARLHIAERYVPKLQAVARGALLRSRINRERQQRVGLQAWIETLQAHSRGALVRKAWGARLHKIRAVVPLIVKTQAQARGVLQRRKFAKLLAAMKSCKPAVVKLQSLARARIAQRTHQEVQKSFSRPVVVGAIIGFQAHARGVLFRRRIARLLVLLEQCESGVVLLQAHARGVLVRRPFRAQIAKLEDATDIVIRIQAAVRTYLARKRLLSLIRGLRKATPYVVALQAVARAKLVQRKYAKMRNALCEVKTASSVGNLQALARAVLARSRHREQAKRLEFVEPNVVGLQAVARSFLARQEYRAWLDYLHRSHPHATILQALLRGAMQRRKFIARMKYYRENLDKVVQIQSLFRAKETREQYRQLTSGTNVTVGTIKNFVHLLDDSETDFQEEIKIERLRQDVVKRIRENQVLESHVDDLDVRIALVVQNVKSSEELLKIRRRHGTDSVALHAARASVLAAHGDPFAGSSTVDQSAKRKLELYQQLFYLLQTRGEYLARLFDRISEDQAADKNKKVIERVVLALFSYGQDRREDYLLLKLFQVAVHERVASINTIEEVSNGHPIFMNIAVQYLRPKLAVYAKETLQSIIKELIADEDLDLEADPVAIYQARIDLEEMRQGVPSKKPKDVSFREALQDPDTRGEYIRHLQLLQWWTEAVVSALVQSTERMPYAIRHLARETLRATRDRFPDTTEAAHTCCVARLMHSRFINPIIMAPETLDIVSNTVSIQSRKNLAQISRMLEQISRGCEFGDDDARYVPVNDYVNKATKQMTSWLFQVTDVADAETQYQAHEFMDAATQPKSIWITPNEVYGTHAILSKHLDYLAPGREDALRIILTDLEGAPHFGNDELNDARDASVELRLTNRFADVKDPNAAEKALWVQAKRAVLAILRVQPAKDLMEALMQPVTDEHEHNWEMILEEMAREQFKYQRRMPSTTHTDSAYRLEDIRSMSFREVKAHAIFFLLELEKQRLISREDGYQAVLDAIALDVRNKNRRRVQRQHDKESMLDTLQKLEERKKYFEAQINDYHNYVETAMSTMQRGKSKKRFILPFTRQYFHTRDLQKSGKAPQFGSYKYSAQHFYEKGILLSIDQFSPRQYDRLDIVLSSNQVGVFTIEIFNNALGITNRMAHGDVKMEDLLLAQFENRQYFSMFNGLAKFNLNLLLFQINKKFYA